MRAFRVLLILLSATGFSAVKSQGLSGCGSNKFQNGDSGELSTPNYPSNYANNLRCSWVITGVSGQDISLKFDEFSKTETNYDVIKIFEGSGSNGTLLETFSGPSLPEIFVVDSDVVYIDFSSDSSLSYTGFKIKWKSIVKKPHIVWGCGSSLAYSTALEINHRSYPVPSYTRNVDCHFYITGTPGKNTRFNITSLYTFRSNGDYVKIYNRMKQKYAFVTFGQNFNFVSSFVLKGHRTHVHYHSGSGWSDTNKPLFSWTDTTETEFFPSGCGTGSNRFQNADGAVIQSTNYPGLFDFNSDCEWLIVGTPGKHILLSFNATIYLRHSHLKIYKGDSIVGQPIHWYFFGGAPPYVAVEGEMALIKFTFNSYERSIGFQIKVSQQMFFTSGCNPSDARNRYHQEGTSGVIESSNYPLNFEKYTTCFWSISGTPGKNILLKFNETSFSLSFATNLYIYTGNASIKTQLVQYSYIERAPSSTVVEGEKVYIKFTSSWSHATSTGFQIFWSVTDKPVFLDSGCGDNTHQTGNSGIISCGNYPVQYDKYTYCKWLITGIKGKSISLKFSANYSLSNDAILKIYKGKMLSTDKLLGM